MPIQPSVAHSYKHLILCITAVSPRFLNISRNSKNIRTITVLYIYYFYQINLGILFMKQQHHLPFRSFLSSTRQTPSGIHFLLRQARSRTVLWHYVSTPLLEFGEFVSQVSTVPLNKLNWLIPVEFYCNVVREVLRLSTGVWPFL
jgi:hypothetical protein